MKKDDDIVMTCTLHDIEWRISKEAYPPECPMCLQKERNELRTENDKLKRRNSVLLEAIQLKALVQEVK